MVVSQTRGSNNYRIPALLADIRLLDMLELTGATVHASTFLNITQPTVSRRYRALAADFGLLRQLRQRKRARYGSSEAINCLRQGARSHRLAAGYVRLGASLFHGHLLAHLPQALPMPRQVRPLEEWAELVRLAVIDGALLSSLEITAQHRQNSFTGLHWIPLVEEQLVMASHQGQQPLQLLAPHRSLAPGLWHCLERQGLPLKAVHSQHYNPERWLQLLRTTKSAMAVAPELLNQAPWQSQGLVSQPLPQPLHEQLGLLIPAELAAEPTIAAIRQALLPAPGLTPKNNSQPSMR